MNDESTNSTAERAPAQPGSETVRIAQLTGDRACIKCHFNLSGQTIVREPHYGLLIVRCPECGSACPVQEYPVLGRWAGRLGALLAAGYFCFLLAFALACAGATAGISYAVTELLSSPLQQFAYDRTIQHEQSKMASVGPPTQPQFYGNQAIDMEWWEGLPPSKLIVDAGGWFGGAIDWRQLWIWVYIALVGLPLGVVWAVAMPGARWRRFVLVTLLIMLLATLFITLARFGPGSAGRFMGAWYVRELILSEVFWQLVWPSLLASGVVLLAGMLLGRPIARGLVRLLLPPRLWAPFSFLWIADNRPLPRP